MVLKGKKKTNIIGPLKQFFEAHPDEEITIYRLITATGFDDDQIRNALSNARAGGYPLEVAKRGKAWIYRNNIEETPQEESQESAMRTVYDGVTDDEKGFYMVSVNKEGLPVLQRDHDGTVWIAHPV